MGSTRGEPGRGQAALASGHMLIRRIKGAARGAPPASGALKSTPPSEQETMYVFLVCNGLPWVRNSCFVLVLNYHPLLLLGWPNHFGGVGGRRLFILVVVVTR